MSESSQTRSFGDVGLMSGLPESGPGWAQALALAGELRERAARDDTKLAERGMALSRRLDQTLRDESAAVVIATMRQLAAGLLQHHVHVRPGSLAQLLLTRLFHDPLPRWIGHGCQHTQNDTA